MRVTCKPILSSDDVTGALRRSEAMGIHVALNMQRDNRDNSANFVSQQKKPAPNHASPIAEISACHDL